MTCPAKQSHCLTNNTNRRSPGLGLPTVKTHRLRCPYVTATLPMEIDVLCHFLKVLAERRPSRLGWAPIPEMTRGGLRKQQAKKSPTCKSGFFSLAETEPFELYSSPVFRAFCFLGSPTYLCCVNVTNGPEAAIQLAPKRSLKRLVSTSPSDRVRMASI